MNRDRDVEEKLVCRVTCCSSATAKDSDLARRTGPSESCYGSQCWTKNTSSESRPAAWMSESHSPTGSGSARQMTIPGPGQGAWWSASHHVVSEFESAGRACVPR